MTTFIKQRNVEHISLGTAVWFVPYGVKCADNRKWWIVKDATESRSDLITGITLEFAWKYWGCPLDVSVSAVGVSVRSEGAGRSARRDLCLSRCKIRGIWTIISQPVNVLLGAHQQIARSTKSLNPLNAELNLISHLLALLGAHHILHVSRVRVNLVLSSQDMQFAK